ncbi:helix-turn-helix domain-containing protein [Streptomyces flavofungini]|uniref:helix-turn-helix domain-containing protein n=1 Tax=Streptomyces flavofungini TaxID=68200 RepID=UPI0025B1612C|nr:helix-turn-helix transcriptional regulator [Streptomyces flavofungini]WJV50680.1 helix-turn-helix transcriptional regulator [Streptomyces flavofungini]
MAAPDPSTRTFARDPELGFPPPGEVLHRLRTQRGMSLRQVAAECGLSVSFLASLERGETDIALERLGRLAKVFGHDVGSFLGFSRGRAAPSVFPREEQETLDRAPGVVYRVLRSPDLGYRVVTGGFGRRRARQGANCPTGTRPWGFSRPRARRPSSGGRASWTAS